MEKSGVFMLPKIMLTVTQQSMNATDFSILSSLCKAAFCIRSRARAELSRNR